MEQIKRIQILANQIINDNKNLKNIISEIEKIVDHNYMLYGIEASTDLMRIRKIIKTYKSNEKK